MRDDLASPSKIELRNATATTESTKHSVARPLLLSRCAWMALEETVGSTQKYHTGESISYVIFEHFFITLGLRMPSEKVP